MMDANDKVREKRLSIKAELQGFLLRRSKSGLYRLVDSLTNKMESGENAISRLTRLKNSFWTRKVFTALKKHNPQVYTSGGRLQTKSYFKEVKLVYSNPPAAHLAGTSQ